MKVITANKNILLMEFFEKDRRQRSFIFDINVILDVPEAKSVIIRDPREHERTWSMSGKKFFHQEKYCIGDVVLLPKTDMSYHPAKRKAAE